MSTQYVKVLFLVKINLSEPNATISKNKKAFETLSSFHDDVDGRDTAYRYREFVFGGYGTETIYVLYRIASTRNFEESGARWRFHKTNTLEAIASLPGRTRTRSHTPSKVSTYGKVILKIFEEDWEAFTAAMTRNYKLMDGVNVYYYKAVHGLKLKPERALVEINRLIAVPKMILVLQIHHAVEFRKTGALITFKLGNVRKMSHPARWQQATKYRKYFLRGGYGHFSGLESLSAFPQVTSAQGYEPIAHLLPDKRGPPTWMSRLFNGMQLAPHNDRLDIYGNRMANEELQMHQYFERVCEDGICARFEAVCTYTGNVVAQMNADDNIWQRFVDELYIREVVVVVDDFTSLALGEGHGGLAKLLSNLSRFLRVARLPP